MMRHWRARRARIEDNRVAIAKQERLAKAIAHQVQEANQVNEHARQRLERNHLTELFEAIIGGRA